MSIEPSLAGGFRDYLPADMIPRQKMFDTIRSVFERFGFAPLDTPGLEKEEILTGGEESFAMHIFRIGSRATPSREDLALRFDLTVPLARVVAQYADEIKRPFKRYQIGKVWRGESQQAGRFREFVQCDADIVGSSNSSADAEIISLIYETMTTLGFKQFLIRVNNRKILNGLPEYAGFAKEDCAAVLRTIDKFDKIGWDGVAKELALTKENGGCGIEKSAIEAIQKFISLRGENNEETLDTASLLMKNSAVATEGIEELHAVARHLKALGVPDQYWSIDLSTARGLGYYTGTVFETILTDLPSIGSVFSGGRYDDLVARFGKLAIPATGASIGVDRLFAAMEKLDLVKREKSIARVLVLNFEPLAEGMCERVTSALRRADISTELYLGSEATLKAQLAFAVRQEYPIVVIVGSDEMKKGVVMIKNMTKRTQSEVAEEGIIQAIRMIAL